MVLYIHKTEGRGVFAQLTYGIGLAQTPPCVGAARERMHTHDPQIFQAQRRTGARGFVGSSAKHDDIAIAWNLSVAFRQLVETDS
jgi:hypothetical protein